MTEEEKIVAGKLFDAYMMSENIMMNVA